MSQWRTVCLTLLLLPTMVCGSEPSNRVEKTALRTIEVVESVNQPLNPGARKLILATDIGDAYGRAVFQYPLDGSV